MDIISAIALLVPVASAVASGVNEVIRSGKGKPSTGWAIVSIVINTLACNVDKVKQAVSVLKSKK